MSKSKTNIAMVGFKGKFGNQYVLRRDHGNTILASKPEITKKNIAAGQVASRNTFRAATEWAKVILKNPVHLEAFKALTHRGQSPYTLATTNYLRLPWFENIDTSQYSGVFGDKICVTAFDLYKVVRVTVVIKNPGGTVIEKGDCIKDPLGITWDYAAMVANQNVTGSTVTVVVYNLPKHSVGRVVTL